MELILDVQGFIQSDGKFVPKELASIWTDRGLTGVQSLRYQLFKPPCEWTALSDKAKVANSWTMRNCHRLPWHVGDRAYSDVKKVLIQMVEGADCLYVKGIDKKLWLKEMLDDSIPIIDLTQACWGCPPLHLLFGEVHRCRYHELYEIESKNPRTSDNVASYRCAVENVQRVQKWFWEWDDANQDDYSTSEEEDDDDNKDAEEDDEGYDEVDSLH